MITYNRSLVALPNHYGALPQIPALYHGSEAVAAARSCGAAIIMPDKGKVERSYGYIRQDFFLARAFRNMDDLNTQFEDWRATTVSTLNSGLNFRAIISALQFIGHDLIVVSMKPAAAQTATA